MPTPRAGAAVAVLGKQILVVGGVGEDQSPLKVVEMYNTEEGRWRRRSALREALMGVSMTVKGMQCFIPTFHTSFLLVLPSSGHRHKQNNQPPEKQPFAAALQSNSNWCVSTQSM